MRIRRRSALGGLFLVAVFVAAALVRAQESVTITLRSGETFAAELVDLGGAGFTIRRGGVDSRLPMDRVAAVDFVGGSTPDAQWSQVQNGRHLLILRSGLAVAGLWDDVGGTRPLRITFVGDSGSRDYASSEVARILLAPRPTMPPPVPSPGPPPPTAPPGPTGGCPSPSLFAGVWDGGPTWGGLTLAAGGGCRVTGVYSDWGGGRFDGTSMALPTGGGTVLNGFRFRWTNSAGTDGGEGYATLTADGNTLNGVWCRPNNCDPYRTPSVWYGKRSGAAPPTTAPPPAGGGMCGSLSQMLGTWNTTGFGALTLQNPSGCSVTGSYTASAGTIAGNAMGNTISFRWTMNGGSDSGDAYVTLVGPGRLEGRWCRGIGCPVSSGSAFTGTR